MFFYPTIPCPKCGHDATPADRPSRNNESWFACGSCGYWVRPVETKAEGPADNTPMTLVWITLGKETYSACVPVKVAEEKGYERQFPNGL